MDSRLPARNVYLWPRFRALALFEAVEVAWPGRKLQARVSNGRQDFIYAKDSGIYGYNGQKGQLDKDKRQIFHRWNIIRDRKRDERDARITDQFVVTPVDVVRNWFHRCSGAERQICLLVESIFGWKSQEHRDPMPFLRQNSLQRAKHSVWMFFHLFNGVLVFQTARWNNRGDDLETHRNLYFVNYFCTNSKQM